MSFPVNPLNGQITTQNNIVYVYSSATNSWRRDVSNFIDRLLLVGTADATDTTTGTLVVKGGVGIAKKIAVGGQATLQSGLSVAGNSTFTGIITALNAVSLSPANANVTISPNNGGSVTIFPTSLGYIDNIAIGGNNARSGRFTTVEIINDTPSVGLGTGALTVAGGAGIVQDLYVGGTIYGKFQGEAVVTATVTISIGGGVPGQVLYQSSTGTTGFTNVGDTGSILVSYGPNSPLFQNFLNLSNSTNSVSTTTGALVVAGGVGIGGNLQIGGDVTIGGIPLLNLISGRPWKIISNTSTYQASTGDRLMINTTASIVTIILPVTPSLGDYIQFLDYGNNFDVNPAIIARSNEKIMGFSENLTIDVRSAANTLIYSNIAQGWKLGALI